MWRPPPRISRKQPDRDHGQAEQRRQGHSLSPVEDAAALKAGTVRRVRDDAAGAQPAAESQVAPAMARPQLAAELQEAAYYPERRTAWPGGRDTPAVGEDQEVRAPRRCRRRTALAVAG